MPAIFLVTNVKLEDEKAFILEFSKFGAEILGMPEPYVSISFIHNPNLTFGGTFDPAFLLDIISSSHFDGQESNAKYSKTFFKFIEDKLGVPHDRGYIKFSDTGRAYLGFQSTTLLTLLGEAK